MIRFIERKRRELGITKNKLKVTSTLVGFLILIISVMVFNFIN